MRALLTALWRLPARQREVIALRIFLDLDTGTIARQLGIEAGTVRMHLSRGVAALRRELTPTKPYGGRSMNIHDEMSDDEVLRAAATSCQQCRWPGPRCRAQIMARGRARRRRTVTGLGLAGTAGAAALALGMAGVFGGHRPARTGTTISTAAFTLAKAANGTATLKLSQDQVFDPGALQQALGQDGIPALVKIDTFCSSNPAPPRRIAPGSCPFSCPMALRWSRPPPATSRRFPPMP